MEQRQSARAGALQHERGVAGRMLGNSIGVDDLGQRRVRVGEVRRGGGGAAHYAACLSGRLSAEAGEELLGSFVEPVELFEDFRDGTDSIK